MHFTKTFWAKTKTLVQVDGIEPTIPAWKAGVLPLNYTCKWFYQTRKPLLGQVFYRRKTDHKIFKNAHPKKIDLALVFYQKRAWKLRRIARGRFPKCL